MTSEGNPGRARTLEVACKLRSPLIRARSLRKRRSGRHPVTKPVCSRNDCSSSATISPPVRPLEPCDGSGFHGLRSPMGGKCRRSLLSRSGGASRLVEAFGTPAGDPGSWCSRITTGITRLDALIKRAWLALRRSPAESPEIRSDSSPFPPSYHREGLSWLGDGVPFVPENQKRGARPRSRAVLGQAGGQGRIGAQALLFSRYRGELRAAPPRARSRPSIGAPVSRSLRDGHARPMEHPGKAPRAMGYPFLVPAGSPSRGTLRERCSPYHHEHAHRREGQEQAWPGRRVLSILNGWDEEPLPVRPWPSQFRIVFAGSIYLDRTPRPFFRSLVSAEGPSIDTGSTRAAADRVSERFWR